MTWEVNLHYNPCGNWHANSSGLLEILGIAPKTSHLHAGVLCGSAISVQKQQRISPAAGSNRQNQSQ